MAKQLQLRRGTTVQNNAFIGAVGEPTLDTETGMIHIHDGVTQGGKDFIDPVVAEQKPTGTYLVWYRKYASGLVEQGGFISATGCAGNSTRQLGEPVFSIPLKDQKYDLQFSFVKTGSYWSWVECSCYKVDNTKIHIELYNNSGNSWTANTGNGVYWRVRGFAA